MHCFHSNGIQCFGLASLEEQIVLERTSLWIRWQYEACDLTHWTKVRQLALISIRPLTALDSDASELRSEI